jgi:hypothetical protein
MIVKVADTHAHVQRLISAVKIATVLEEQRSVVRFSVGKRAKCKGYS